MTINWHKPIQTSEELLVTDYLNNRIATLKTLLNILTDDLLSVTFTPPPLNNNFYTFELRYHHTEKEYIINVWKGLRTGDTQTLLHGIIRKE